MVDDADVLQPLVQLAEEIHAVLLACRPRTAKGRRAVALVLSLYDGKKAVTEAELLDILAAMVEVMRLRRRVRGSAQGTAERLAEIRRLRAESWSWPALDRKYHLSPGACRQLDYQARRKGR